MKLGILICAFFLINTMASSVSADNDPEIPWPVEDHCVSAPILPPESWSYSGTLLMSGYAGIHAMQWDWETPRIVAYFRADDLGEPISGGQISPNGYWYVAPIGEIFTERSYNRYWFTRGLRVYSTFDDTQINFDLHEYNNLLDYARSYGAWTYEVVRWIDNETFVFGPFLFRPFDNSVQASNFPIAIAGVEDFEVAPDWKRIYGYINWGSPQGILDPTQPDVAVAYLEAQAVALAA